MISFLRDLQVDIFQVVLGGASDNDFVDQGLDGFFFSAFRFEDRFGCFFSVGIGVEQVFEGVACRGVSLAILSGVRSADDLARRLCPLRAQVDDPVGRFDHVHVVLDDEDSVALVDEVVEHLEQLLDVVRSGGRWSARRGCRAFCRSRGGPALWRA